MFGSSTHGYRWKPPPADERLADVEAALGVQLPASLRAIYRLLGDGALRERLGAGGLLRAGQFTAATVVPRFEAAYERARASRRASLGD